MSNPTAAGHQSGSAFKVQRKEPSEHAQAINELSTKSVHGLFGTVATQALQKHVEQLSLLLSTSGHIGAWRDVTRYSKFYDVELEDDGCVVMLDVRKSLLTGMVKPGDYVRVVGFPSISVSPRDGVVKIKLDVSEVALMDSPEAARRKRSDARTLADVRALRRNRASFPIKSRLSITVIHGRGSKVVPDFYAGLGDAAASHDISLVDVSMLDAAEIAGAIKAANADVLVLVRGGGSASDFQVFGSTQVLTALGDAKGYRIVGLGHTDDTTLADMVVDHAAVTPTAAGVFVRDQQAALQRALGMAASLGEQRARDRFRQSEQSQFLATQQATAKLRQENESAMKAVTSKWRIRGMVFVLVLLALVYLVFKMTGKA
jgi:hypothetical protein